MVFLKPRTPEELFVCHHNIPKMLHLEVSRIVGESNGLSLCIALSKSLMSTDEVLFSDDFHGWNVYPYLVWKEICLQVIGDL